MNSQAEKVLAATSQVIDSEVRSVSVPKTSIGSGQSRVPKPESNQQHARFYRVIWRWHFYAGVIVAPILMVMSITGAIYIFRAELEPFLHPYMYVEESAERVTYQAQIDAAVASLPDGYNLNNIQVWADPRRATYVGLASGPRTDGAKAFRQLYVDHHTGRVQGELPDNEFFDIVLRIHRQLFIGTTGRIITELSLCWTIILLITGTYLWWPRNQKRLWGVWLPRLSGKSYVVLRDLHAVLGFYLMPIAMVISISGLMYTFVWGGAYFKASDATEAFKPFQSPPASISPATEPTLPIDTIAQLAHERSPGDSFVIRPPASPQGGFVCFYWGTDRPSLMAVTVFDRATGKVLSSCRSDELPLLAWWNKWNYTLHVGSILSMPTKIIWLLACIVLTLLPVTGFWMWWERRPKGRSGLPRRLDVSLSRSIVIIMLLLGLFMPVVGISMIVILLGDWLVNRSWKRSNR